VGRWYEKVLPMLEELSCPPLLQCSFFTYEKLQGQLEQAVASDVELADLPDPRMQRHWRCR